MSLSTDDRVEAIAALETKAFKAFRRFIAKNRDLLFYVARQGDGRCGALAAILIEELTPANGNEPRARVRAKAKIPHQLRTAVLERDQYRCKHCGTHLALTIDHIHPESKGGETVESNLQTLCRPCNSRKGTRIAA